MSGFQTQVNLNQAPAQAGDFAGTNPNAAMVAGAGTLVAGSAGVTIGRFAWASAAGAVKGAWQAGNRIGFVPRLLQGLITTWLAESGYLIQAGSGMSLMVAGDFWAKFAGGASVGQKVYAYYADGTCYGAATATPPTVSATVNTTNGSATVTVSAVSGTPLAAGQPISGTGIPAGAYISALGTGSGGTGTYTISANATADGTGVTATVTTAIETAFKVCSAASAGELAKISTWG